MKEKNIKEFWKSHLDKAISSGKSKNHYCKENNISEKTFYYWQRKLYGKMRQKTKNEHGDKDSNFLPIKIEDKKVKEDVQLSLPCGISLKSKTYPDALWLSELLINLCGKSCA
jgi:hypothetical protein